MFSSKVPCTTHSVGFVAQREREREWGVNYIAPSLIVSPSGVHNHPPHRFKMKYQSMNLSYRSVHRRNLSTGQQHNTVIVDLKYIQGNIWNSVLSL